VTTYLTVYVKTTDVIDLEKERLMILEQMEKIRAEIKRSEQLLSNQNFLQKAHPDKIKIETNKFEAYKLQYQALLDKMS
jgi:valyl-tRNA synthetase